MTTLNVVQGSTSAHSHHEEEQTALLGSKDNALQNSSGQSHHTTAISPPTPGRAAGRSCSTDGIKTLWRHTKALVSVIWDSGPLCMSVAAFVFSCSALFVKLTGGRVPTFEIVVVRSSLSWIACWWGAHQAGIKPLYGHRKNLHFLIARGLFGAAAMTTYYMSIERLPLADAVTLFFLNPAVTAVAAWLIMREPLGLIAAGGVVTSLLGLVIMTRPPFIFDSGQGWDHERVLGTFFGLLSAFFAAGAFIAIRFIGKGEPAIVMSVYFHTCALSSSILPLALGVPKHAVLPPPVDMLLLVLVAATSFWGQILIGRGFQLLAAAQASAINFTQVIYSYAFGLIFLHESITLMGLMGSALIAVGVILVNIRSKKKAPAPAVAAAAQGQQQQGYQVEVEMGAASGVGAAAVAAGSNDDAGEEKRVLTGVPSSSDEPDQRNHQLQREQRRQNGEGGTPQLVALAATTLQDASLEQQHHQHLQLGGAREHHQEQHAAHDMAGADTSVTGTGVHGGSATAAGGSSSSVALDIPPQQHQQHHALGASAASDAAQQYGGSSREAAGALLAEHAPWTSAPTSGMWPGQSELHHRNGQHHTTPSTPSWGHHGSGSHFGGYGSSAPVDTHTHSHGSFQDPGSHHDGGAHHGGD